MFDGLDELISRDPKFYDYLLEILTWPHATARPRILICVRDSLFANSELDELIDLTRRYANVYHLERWKVENIKRLAALTRPAQAQAFSQSLDRRPEWQQLGSIPFYARLLIDHYDDTELDVRTEDSFVDSSVKSLLQREYSKGLLDGGVGAAEKPEARRHRAILYQSISVRVFRAQLREQLQFAHELFQDYFVGVHLASLLERGDTRTFVHYLATQPFAPDSLALRLAARPLSSKATLADVLTSLLGTGLAPTAAKNIVQVIARGTPRRDVLKGALLDRLDLSRVRFIDLDLKKTSFRGGDLTETVFEKCLLEGAIFYDSTLEGTAFDPARDLMKGARFGSMARFRSIRPLGGRLVTNLKEAAKWIRRQTGEIPATDEPCLGARQMWLVFSKFIAPDGSPKRDIIDEKGVLSGRRFDDPAAVLESSVRQGYLTDLGKGKIRRATGDRYSEMVEYVKQYSLTDGLRAVLGDVCKLESCKHVAPT